MSLFDYLLYIKINERQAKSLKLSQNQQQVFYCWSKRMRRLLLPRLLRAVHRNQLIAKTWGKGRGFLRLPTKLGYKSMSQQPLLNSWCPITSKLLSSSLISKCLAHNTIVYFYRILTSSMFTLEQDFACPVSVLYIKIALNEIKCRM